MTVLTAHEEVAIKRATQELELAMLRTIEDMRPMFRQKYGLADGLVSLSAGAALVSVGLTLLLGHRTGASEIKREAVDLIRERVKEARSTEPSTPNT